MPSYSEELRADHANIRGLLGRISEKQTAFDHGQGDDYVHLCRAVGTLSDFLKYDHHPKEEALIDSLVICDPRLAQPANALLQEHRLCEQQTVGLIKMLDSKKPQANGQDGHVRTISTLLEQLPMFMDIEETFLYPMIERFPEVDEFDLNQLGRFERVLEEYKGKPL